MKEMTLAECAKLAKDNGMTYGQMQAKLFSQGLSWLSCNRMNDVESPFVRHVKEECRRIRREREEGGKSR